MSGMGVAVAGLNMSGMDMAGMDMAGMDMAGAEPVYAANDSSLDQTSTASPDGPCDESRTSNTCPTMAPCVFASLPATAWLRAHAEVEQSGAVALLVTMPRSVRAAPELPPPRT